MEAEPLPRAQDGLPARSVGIWSKDKLHYIRRHLEIFTRSMHNKFQQLVYVDLFAGPGRCIVRDGSNEELDGSPLLALKLPIPFTEYHLVELEHRAAEALRARAERDAPTRIVQYYGEDANTAVATIAARIPTEALSLALIDPTGLDFTFSSLRRLTEGRRMDLIYLFPEGMSVKRNMDKFLGQKHSPLDEALGTDMWRERVRIHKGLDPLGRWEAVGRPIVEILQEQLRRLGYVDVGHLGSEVEIRNTKQVPLYYLVFASRHTMGYELWKKAIAIHPDGQRHLPI